MWNIKTEECQKKLDPEKLCQRLKFWDNFVLTLLELTWTGELKVPGINACTALIKFKKKMKLLLRFQRVIVNNIF